MAHMKRLALLMLLASSALAVEAPTLGVITATTSAAKNQTDTAVPFAIPTGQHIVIDCVDGAGNSANAYLRFVNSTTATVTSGNFARMTSYWETFNGSTYQYLSVLGVNGTVNCHVTTVSP